MQHVLESPPRPRPGTPAPPARRRLARWPLWLLLAALVYAVMPAVHHATFGAERIRAAAVQDVRERVGEEVTAGMQQVIADSFTSSPPWMTGAVAFFTTLLGIAVAGVLLNAGTMLTVSDLSAAQTLSVASAAALAVAAMRVVLWTVCLVVRGLDGLRGLDWMAPGRVNLTAVLGPDHQGYLLYTLTATDLTLLFGAVVAAIGLSLADPRMRVLTAVCISLVWPATVIVTRIGMSALLGFPVG